MYPLLLMAFLDACLASCQTPVQGPVALIRSHSSGRWSQPATWEGGKVPAAGSRVQVRTGHVVTFDTRTNGAIRSIHVAGTLRFDPDRDTRLDVGLIKIQTGEDASESGFDCEGHVTEPGPGQPRPALEIGTPDQPIAAGHTALIRLAAVAGLDLEECPAIVCCGGRWDTHGAPLDSTWGKLGSPAAAGATTIVLSQPVPGWRVGDRLIVTATNRQAARADRMIPHVSEQPQTEERLIRSIEGTVLTLDAPLTLAHSCFNNRRGEVANLSRNVVIESADPSASGVRGHTMFHNSSAGSISYTEFRHLGKEGKLGKYSLHFHRVGDSMRGSSVIGASIWDSANRWITIHGTNRLVVRDCVGYRSVGHGFFLEDGTEVENILDHNLAVQAVEGKPLPGQVFPLDHNDGAGFWWANSHNAFTRNVAVECDEYGYRFDAPESPGSDPVLAVKTPAGPRRKLDIRSLPFLRFEDNEAHDQRHYGMKLGGGSEDAVRGGIGAVGPNVGHPFMIKNFRVWDAHWALTPAVSSLLIDGMEVAESDFGLWRPRYDRHAYRNLAFFRTRWPEAYPTGDRPHEAIYPSPLNPVDDQPPVTVITRISLSGRGIVVQGATVDNGVVRSVQVNGVPARALAPNYLEWEAVLDRQHRPGRLAVVASAADTTGNEELDPHRASIEIP